MQIDIIGAGPAGLFLAILLRKRLPRARVAVLERLPRGETYGFGVVLADPALALLADEDRATHDALRPRLRSWQEFAVIHRGEAVRFGAPPLHGISRRALLEVLAARAEAAGADLRYDADAGDLRRRAARADVLVGADGVASAVRAAWRRELGPSVARGGSRYLWCGTPASFPSIALAYKRVRGGVLVAHCYPHARDASTVVVECDEATFERAGLAGAGAAASRAILEGAFADVLGGAPLRTAPRARWTRFATVRCRRWVHENVALVGDAAHTIHFSLGAGTSLALGDAAELARAFDRTKLAPAALESYEWTRKPALDSHQAAAGRRADWLATTARHMRLPPLDFALEVMSRGEASLRATYREAIVGRASVAP